MEIAKNQTTLNKKIIRSFQNREILKKSWIIGVCSLLLILLSFGIKNGQIFLRSIPFLVIGILVFPVYVLILKILFSKQNKSFEEITLNYTFTDEKIIVLGKNSTSSENSEMPYSKIEKINNTKNFLFLYITPYSALVIDKNGFSIGDANKIIALLSIKNKKR